MSNKITCPVCDRAEIEIDICPNCQTDLALLRILAELPLLEPIDSSFELPKWSVLGLLLVFILLGWGLWMY